MKKQTMPAKTEELDIKEMIKSSNSCEVTVISDGDNNTGNFFKNPATFLRMCCGENDKGYESLILQKDYFSKVIFCPFMLMENIIVKNGKIFFTIMDKHYCIELYDHPLSRVRDRKISSTIWYDLDAFALYLPELIDETLSGNIGDTSYFVIDLFRLGIPRITNEADIDNRNNCLDGWIKHRLGYDVHRTSTVYHCVNKKTGEKKIGLWDMELQIPYSECSVERVLPSELQIRTFLKKNDIKII